MNKFELFVKDNMVILIVANTVIFTLLCIILSNKYSILAMCLIIVGLFNGVYIINYSDKLRNKFKKELTVMKVGIR